MLVWLFLFAFCNVESIIRHSLCQCVGDMSFCGDKIMRNNDLTIFSFAQVVLVSAVLQYPACIRNVKSMVWINQMTVHSLAYYFDVLLSVHWLLWFFVVRDDIVVGNGYSLRFATENDIAMWLPSRHWYLLQSMFDQMFFVPNYLSLLQLDFMIKQIKQIKRINLFLISNRFRNNFNTILRWLTIILFYYWI